MVYALVAIAHPVLFILVFVKSQRDYRDFVRFVKWVLLFEIIHTAYTQAVEQYLQTGFHIDAPLIISVVMILLLGYFVWYRLNMQYFKKRIIAITYDHYSDDPNRVIECKFCGHRYNNIFNACPKCGKYEENADLNGKPAAAPNKIRYCRKCGERLNDGSRFCQICGSEIVEEPAAVDSQKSID